MAALEHRRRTGEGQWIEMSLNECGAAFCCEALLRRWRPTGVGARPGRQPRPPLRPPRRLPLRRESISGWRSPCSPTRSGRVLAALARPARPGRRPGAGHAWPVASARHDELDAAIAGVDDRSRAVRGGLGLQRAGVSAAPVLANWQVLPDPHLHHRGFYQPHRAPGRRRLPDHHLAVALLPHPGPAGRPGAAVRRAQPARSCAEAGFDEARIEALYAAGVTADEPLV